MDYFEYMKKVMLTDMEAKTKTAIDSILSQADKLFAALDKGSDEPEIAELCSKQKEYFVSEVIRRFTDIKVKE